MKSFWTIIAICLLAPISFAQQSDQPKPNQKKPAAAEKAAEPKPEAAEQKPPAENSGDRDKDKDKGKEEHFDMTETAPVITHHQITVDGKLLKYTATAGRLPIKRGDGKIEAEPGPPLKAKVRGRLDASAPSSV